MIYQIREIYKVVDKVAIRQVLNNRDDYRSNLFVIAKGERPSWINMNYEYLATLNKNKHIYILEGLESKCTEGEFVGDEDDT